MIRWAQLPDAAAFEVDDVHTQDALDSYGNERPMVERTHERYAQVQALRAKSLSLNAISRELGLAFRTVRKYANATGADELLAPTLARSSKLDQFKPYLTRRWNEGRTNAVQLHTEIVRHVRHLRNLRLKASSVVRGVRQKGHPATQDDGLAHTEAQAEAS
ncbi:hypothetical protein [Nonomuraea insulae]|uniref:HTH IS21-type domain-containing protein n=1 Tax=Nonomuraea insulae TaxID=1616787 RepID=A0ABW1CJ13_9ACTN